eukprot:6140342-Amphidinium_carterae.1
MHARQPRIDVAETHLKAKLGCDEVRQLWYVLDLCPQCFSKYGLTVSILSAKVTSKRAVAL